MKPLDELTLLMTPLQSKEHLQAWLFKFMDGLTLPDQRITQFSDSTPLDFVWEVYRAIMDGTPLHTMALSGRDSSKTVSLSIIALLSLIHDQRPMIHIAMTREQAKRAREYVDRYILNNQYLRDSVALQNAKEIKLNIGKDQVNLELISLNPKAVQGAHYSLVSYDELTSSTQPENLKAYKDSSGIPGTSPKGKPPVIVKITTRQSGFTIAEQEIKNAAKSGIKIVKWSTFDCTSRCTDDRSGTEDLPLWINLIRGMKYTDEQFNSLMPEQQNGFKRVTTTKTGCLSCPLAVYCQGNLKNQTSDSVLLRDIESVIHKVNSGGHEFALSQLCSLQPSSEGLVYPDFNPAIHMPGWNAIWERLTGSPPNKDITKEEFIRECKHQRVDFVAGVDWGYTAPSTVVVLGIDAKDNVYVVESFGMTKKNDSEWVQVLKQTVFLKYDIQMFLPDSESQSGVDFFRGADMPVASIDKGPGSVLKGINLVRSILRVPGTNNDTRMLFSPDLPSPSSDVPGIIEEMFLYSKEVDTGGNVIDDKVRKGNDHFLDALRYAIYWYYGKAKGKALTGYYSATTAAPLATTPVSELARMHGVKFEDNRAQFDENGNPLPGSGDDDPNKPSGGKGGMQFVWT
jgi:hypothetical protein